jgi:hypothetical protein
MMQFSFAESSGTMALGEEHRWRHRIQAVTAARSPSNSSRAPGQWLSAKKNSRCRCQLRRESSLFGECILHTHDEVFKKT